MKFFDRLLTIVITATLTSVFWIVAGDSLIKLADEHQQADDAVVVSEPSSESTPQPTSAPTTPAAPEAVSSEVTPRPSASPTGAVSSTSEPADVPDPADTAVAGDSD